MNIIIHPEKHNERMNARLSSARSDDELLSSVVRAVLFLKILYLFLFIIISMKSKTTREISHAVIPIVDPRSLPRTFPLRVPLSNARALSLVKTFSSKLLLKIFPTKSATSFIHFHFNVVNAKKKYHRSNAKGLATKGTKTILRVR